MALANVASVSEDLAQTYAIWLYRCDPGIEQVFVVEDRAKPEAVDRGEVFLVVARTDIEEPREFPRSPSGSSAAFPLNVWELPVARLADVRDGAAPAPEGFEPDRWQFVERPAAPGSVSPAMQLERLRLQNVRCVESLSLDLQPGFNLIIGNNGAGKSTILDSIATAFELVVDHITMRDYDSDLMTEEDVRLVAVNRGQTTTNEQRYPAKIDLEVRPYGQEPEELCWDVLREDGAIGYSAPTPSGSIFDFLSILRWSVRTDHPTPLPVFAYYRTSRTSPESGTAFEEHRKDSSRLSGYHGWVDANADLKRFERWLERKELEQYQQGETLGVFAAVKQAVMRCMNPQHLHDFEFNAKLGALATRSRGGPWISFSRLSAGVRNMFGLVVDLAVRCATLNPQLGIEAAAKTSGVVLIDELDLHLHPTWQRRVINDLRAAFPAIQFIATTHSGLLLSNLQPHEIITLEIDEATGRIDVLDGEKKKDPRLLTSSELYDEYFGVEGFFAQELGRVLDDYRYWARNPHRDDEHEALVHEWKRRLDAESIDPKVELVPRRPHDLGEIA